MAHKTPTIIGGELPASNLTLMSTAAAGTTDHIAFQVASQAEAMRIHNSKGVSIGNTTDPGASNLKITGHWQSKAPVTQTGNSSQAATDSSVIFNGSGTITYTLLSAASYVGRWLYVKTIAAQAVNSASSNVCPIGSSTPGTAILTNSAGKWAILQSDGTNWVVMASN